MATEVDPHLDPELMPLLEGFPDIPLNAETLQGFRSAIAEMLALPDPATHPDVTLEEISIPGPEGDDLRCLLYRPAGENPAGALIHIHGGGYVMGAPDMDALRNIGMAQACDCVILSVDYRLAPENPYPAPLEDCMAAANWLAAQAEEFGFPADKLGVMGDSAGAGLAAAAAITARDRGAPAFAFQVLIYPMLAPAEVQVSATTRDKRIGRYIWGMDSDRFGWESLLGSSQGDAAMPPASAKDLSGLPSAFLSVGELDLFVHDNLAYASRLLESGVSVEAHVYPGAFHGFDRAPDAGVARRALADVESFIQRRFA